MKTWEEERIELIRSLINRLYYLDYLSNRTDTDLATELNKESANLEKIICETYLHHLGLMEGDQWTEKGNDFLENPEMNITGVFT